MTSLIVDLLMVHWYTGCMPQASCGFLWRQSMPRFDGLWSLFHSKFIFHILLGKSYISWSGKPHQHFPQCVFVMFYWIPVWKIVCCVSVIHLKSIFDAQILSIIPVFQDFTGETSSVLIVNATFSPVFPHVSPISPQFSRFFQVFPPMSLSFPGLRRLRRSKRCSAVRRRCAAALRRADQWLCQAP